MQFDNPAEKFLPEVREIFAKSPKQNSKIYKLFKFSYQNVLPGK